MTQLMLASPTAQSFDTLRLNQQIDALTERELQVQLQFIRSLFLPVLPAQDNLRQLLL